MAKQHDFSVPDENISFVVRYRDDEVAYDLEGNEVAAKSALASIRIPDGVTVAGTDLGGYTVTRYAQIDPATQEPVAFPDPLNPGWSAFHFSVNEITATARKLDEAGKVADAVEVPAADLARALDAACPEHAHPSWLNVPREFIKAPAPDSRESWKVTLPKGAYDRAGKQAIGGQEIEIDPKRVFAVSNKEASVSLKLSDADSIKLPNGGEINARALSAAEPFKTWLNLPAANVKVNDDIVTIGLADGREATLDAAQAEKILEKPDSDQVSIKLPVNAKITLPDGQTMTPAELRTASNPQTFINFPNSYINQVKMPEGYDGPDRFLVTMPRDMKIGGVDVGGWKMEVSGDNAKLYPHERSTGIRMDKGSEVKLFKPDAATGERNYMPVAFTAGDVAEAREANRAEYAAKNAEKRERKAQPKAAPERKTVMSKRAETPSETKTMTAKRD